MTEKGAFFNSGLVHDRSFLQNRFVHDRERSVLQQQVCTWHRSVLQQQACMWECSSTTSLYLTEEQFSTVGVLCVVQFPWKPCPNCRSTWQTEEPSSTCLYMTEERCLYMTEERCLYMTEERCSTAGVLCVVQVPWKPCPNCRSTWQTEELSSTTCLYMTEERCLYMTEERCLYMTEEHCSTAGVLCVM